MDIRKLQRAIVDGLEDVKAQDIVVFNTEHLSPLFERVVIASGTSNRQTKALAASVRDQVKALGGQILSIEGEDNGEWIIVDCGSAVAHIMQPGIRQYYHLEEIWGGKTVKVKLASEVRLLPKASEGPAEDDEDTPKKPARKTARKAVEVEASTTSAKEKPARKRAPRKTAAPAPVAAPVRRSSSTRKDPEALEQAKAGAVRAAKAAAVAAGQKVAASKARAASPVEAELAPKAVKPAARKSAAGKTAAVKAVKTLVIQPETRRTAPKKTAARKTSSRAK
ncbi:ribosome-associated protein [Sphaerotilus hippei]|uniref:Ribosomal silencing factor RsfS n=1 Tax=Sphaerotilus hippei TaxID=744406 RepID=A0A318H677_9BURK|nr:ribosome silencing factor [Sphaerotilus hippei]PXW94783.1 ribosome-associated protein [Sphaerotilus hippei]